MSEENTISVSDAPPSNSNSGFGMGKIIIIGIFLLLIVTAAGIFFTPLGSKIFGPEEKTNPDLAIKRDLAEKPDDGKLNIETVKFVEIPEILLNLRSATGKSSFLKITITVQSPNDEVGKVVDKLKPLLIDQYQEYLRGLDVEDLSGSAGIERIRSELLTRTNNVISPAKASNVLIPSMLIQ